MPSLDFLENVEAFKGLDDAQLKAIQDGSQIVEFNRDERLFREGAPSNHLWIVKQGEVVLCPENGDDAIKSKPVSQLTCSFVSKAQIFGWSCFVPPYQYRLSGYCASRDCKVIKIERNHLETLFETDPVFGYRFMSYILEVVGTQFHQYQDEIAKQQGEDILHQW